MRASGPFTARKGTARSNAVDSEAYADAGGEGDPR